MINLLSLWKCNGFEILLCGCILFMVFFGIYNKFTDTQGTWKTRKDYFDELKFKLTQQPMRKSTGPPKESKGEKECRRVLEYLFKKPFKSVRPDFLRNPVTGGNFNLELDCYNEELNLAVEYNGVQHYKYVPYMHKNKEAFLNQKYRDDMKRRMCKDAGIILVEVPYTIEPHNIKKYLETELRKYKLL